MKIQDLTRGLRNRLIKSNLVELHLVESLSDTDIIRSFTTCSSCGKGIIGKPIFRAILDSEDIDDFFDITDEYLSEMHKENFN